MASPEKVKEYYRNAVKTEKEAKWQGKFKHFMYCPFTGLGLYNGFRGNRWLRNRIQIFKQFVIPSLQAQSNKNFTLWISWRPEEKRNPIVKEFQKYLETIKDFETIHTFTGVCFYDDKYPPKEARDRLLTAVHGACREQLVSATTDDTGYEWVYMTIQPSDDLYHKNTVEFIQSFFSKNPQFGAVGFRKGYIMDYQTKRLAEWNPKTNPPFYTIKFQRHEFINPIQHVKHTELKHDVPGYPKGTPLPSHEWVGDAFKYAVVDQRGFLVGTHSDNISTVFDHPYANGDLTGAPILKDFGIENVPSLSVPFSLRRAMFKKLPYKIKRKLRYLAGEKKWILRPLFSLIYNGLRN